MQPKVQIRFTPQIQKILIICVTFSFILLILVFKSTVFKSTLMLRNLGNISMDPEIAFTNKKPTFLEYYAEWCEVCKEMAPKINEIKQQYDADINFVFLNVDNPKWDKYIQKYNVNGIPQLDLFDSDSNLVVTLVGLQQENLIKDSLTNLINNDITSKDYKISEFSGIKKNNNLQISPRSHG